MILQLHRPSKAAEIMTHCLVLMVLLPVARADNKDQSGLAAAILLPIFFVAIPVVGVLLLFKSLPNILLPSSTGVIWLFSLLVLGMAGHVITVEDSGTHPFDNNATKFMAAVGILVWLYSSVFAGALVFNLRERFTLLLRYLVLGIDDDCETYKAAVAFTWGFFIKIYFPLKDVFEKPSGSERLNEDAEGGENAGDGRQYPEQDYNVLADDGGEVLRQGSKWQKYTDDATGAPYWHNAETGVSTWTRPADA
eukprot:jgi/Bigna1/66655/fgenesh1_pg.2_\